MKRKLLVPLVLIMLLVNVTSFAFAETSTTTNASSSTNSSTTNTTASDQTDKPVVKPTTAPATLSAVAQSRITNLCANLSNRMDGVTKRLQNVIDRLNSRLDKMSEEGIDVTQAKSNVKDAQIKLDLAKANLKNIDSAVAGFVGSNSPSDSWRDLKFTYLSTRDAIIAAHSLLMQAISKAEIATSQLSAPETTSTTTSSSTYQ